MIFGRSAGWRFVRELALTTAINLAVAALFLAPLGITLAVAFSGRLSGCTP